jgi:hypothetical protein
MNPLRVRVMRRLLSLLILSLLIGPAFGEQPAKTDCRPVRMTWEQRFTQANVAHDGHLSLEEAKGGYPLIAKNFDDIDVDHKGYVTTNDIRAWRVMRKAAHRLTHPQEDGLRPRPAYQRRTDQHASSARMSAVPWNGNTSVADETARMA